MSDGFTKKEKRRRQIVVALWVAMLGYAFFVPGTSAEGFYQCPFNALTGYDCPGCGMTRASTHVLHGEFVESLAFHPFGVVFVFGFTLLALFRLAELVRGAPIELRGSHYLKPYEKYLWIAVLVLAVGFGFGRLFLELAGILTPL